MPRIASLDSNRRPTISACTFSNSFNLDSSVPKSRAARSAEGSTAAECKDKGDTSAAEKRAGR